MLDKPLFIFHVTVKAALKNYTVVQNKASQLHKWAWHTHTQLFYQDARLLFVSVHENTIPAG